MEGGVSHIILKVGWPKIIPAQISELKILMWFFWPGELKLETFLSVFFVHYYMFSIIVAKYWICNTGRLLNEANTTKQKSNLYLYSVKNI